MEDWNYQEKITPVENIKWSNNNFKFWNDYWKNLPLNGLYCINFNNIELRDTFKTPKWNVLYIKCSKCKFSTKNNNSCQTEEIIDKYLKEGYLGIFTSDLIAQIVIKNLINFMLKISLLHIKKKQIIGFIYKKKKWLLT